MRFAVNLSVNWVADLLTHGRSSSWVVAFYVYINCGYISLPVFHFLHSKTAGVRSQNNNDNGNNNDDDDDVDDDVGDDDDEDDDDDDDDDNNFKKNNFIFE